MPEEQVEGRRLKTHMTQVFFRCPGSKKPVPLKRRRSVPSIDSDDQQGRCVFDDVYLFDDLIGGGIVVPNDIINARLGTRSPGSDDWVTPGLFVLVTGAPGSGKTTFALELCYRLARSDNSEFDPRLKDGVSSIYVSAEATASSVIQNAASYGWNEEDVFETLPPEPKNVRVYRNHVFLYGRDARERGAGSAEDVLKALGGDWWTPTDFDGRDLPDPHKRVSVPGRVGTTPIGLRPHILVIDSLNTLGSGAPDELLAILRKEARRYLLIIAIMDTNPTISSEHRWMPSEYTADLEIDFSYARPENYMIRRVWVVKGRFQDHADGWHRMKINPKPPEEADEIVRDPSHPVVAVPNPLNPVIKEGGIFIFPSVHRHLSLARAEVDRAKAEGKAIPRRYSNAIATPFRALTEAIQSKGFPSGSCTSIVGDRGGMKSHLAYYTLLKFLKENGDQRAVIISLRDTEDAAIETLADILLQQVDDDGEYLVPELASRDNATKEEKEAAKDRARAYIRSEFIQKDRLEILYFWPGYISPEEFFHLVCTTVDRPGRGKDEKGQEVGAEPAALVIINGLEQLSARFPLCAKESMFTSGLLSVLTVKGITVIVTSGGLVGLSSDGGGVPAGLLPMSDLIVQTSFRLLPAERVWSSGVWFPTLTIDKVAERGQAPPQETSAPVPTRYTIPTADMVAQRERTAKGQEPHVIYEIIRGPGARECRRRVLFYMGRQGDPQDPERKGNWTLQKGFVHGSVYVRPLADEFPHGERP